MAKIDVSQIEGYENMTPEQKIAALEGHEIPDPDFSGYVKKSVFDQTASDLATVKKQLRDQLSEEEKAEQSRKEELETLQSKYDQLLHKSNVSEFKSKLLSMGYDEKLAADTAEAMANGDTDKIFADLQKHLDSVAKRANAEALKNTPKPIPDGDSKPMTLETLRGMSPQERYEYSVRDPDGYKALYGGDK